MKVMNIACNISSVSHLVKMIDDEKINFYQLFEQVSGKLPKGEPRLNNPVWPGLNNSVFLTCTQEQCENMKQKIKEFNQNAYNDNELIYYNTWTVDD
ncbi:MAG: hypothetical protein RBS16_06855 [Candidatus Cloacimonadales bacterium]|nr:hypothetical protein [Candidatus Cloacimonadota bacterium]MDD3501719.1 hypothetical protein [Candidatus Cloacimonadota bacterium]MDX9977737.1 hypothetical protein [Candidatus Cloacimonadales bacterium]